MAHHGKETDHPMSKELKELMKEYRKDQANQVWPDGMMREDDEGAIPMALGIENGRVMLRFAEPTAWIGFTPEQAVNIAQALIKKAQQAGLHHAIAIKMGAKLAENKK